VPGAFGFAVTFGSSVYTPGYPEVAKKFGVSQTVALLPLSLYVLGLAFGPVLAAPISETKGRRVVYLVSLPIAAVFTLGAGFSQSFAALVVTRFFAGFFSSPVLAVGAGTMWIYGSRSIVQWPLVRFFWQHSSVLRWVLRWVDLRRKIRDGGGRSGCSSSSWCPPTSTRSA